MSRNIDFKRQRAAISFRLCGLLRVVINTNMLRFSIELMTPFFNACLTGSEMRTFTILSVSSTFTMNWKSKLSYRVNIVPLCFWRWAKVMSILCLAFQFIFCKIILLLRRFLRKSCKFCPFQKGNCVHSWSTECLERKFQW